MSVDRTPTLIAVVRAFEALDSRGTPTVACEVELANGACGSATVPSGASTGSHEAVELRDGGERYGGRGVARAVENVIGALGEAVRGLDAADQSSVDAALVAADGSPGLARLGANAVLAVSIASAVAAAAGSRLPLYRYASLDAVDEALLPLPMVNVISGGAHAGGTLDVQDYLVVPVGAQHFAEALEWAWRVRRATAEVAATRGYVSALVADEGGLGPALDSNRRGIELVLEGIERAGLVPGEDVAIALDLAATQFHDLGTGRYVLRAEGRELEAEEWIDEVAGWVANFPLVSLEDVMGEDDWDGWAIASARLGSVQLLGDDLFVTDADRFARGVGAGVANAVLVKPNQVGTLSAAADLVRAARAAGYATVLSARSGETEDSWLADLAVAWETGQIKVGSTMRSERTAKWNRLLRIEAELGGRSRFAGRSALAPKAREASPNSR
jgi:enolase